MAQRNPRVEQAIDIYDLPAIPWSRARDGL